MRKFVAPVINRDNVGRIAESIVANELEVHGYRVTHLNRDGIAANADLLASRAGRIWQVQVKGATNPPPPSHTWVFQLGHCTQATIDRTEPMFNRLTGFYKADVVVLVGVRSLRDYCCVVLSVEIAERAAQLNLKRYFRQPKTKDGSPRKPGRVRIKIDRPPRERGVDPLREPEREIIRRHVDAWQILR